MKLREWEIWFTYSGNLRTSKIDLTRLAKTLVLSDLAYTVLHRDGLTFWRGDTGIGEGNTIVAPNSSKTGCHLNIEPKNNHQVALTGFAWDAWFQGAQFRFAETKLFSSDFEIPPPYLRAFLGQINCKNDSENLLVRLYPTIVIYEAGVIIIEFRTISPNHDVDIKQFINSYINLYQFAFDLVEASPGLTILATEAWAHSQQPLNLLSRAKLLYLNRRHCIAVKQQTETSKEGDFEFELTPLPNAGEKDQLNSLALTILNICSYLSVNPRKNFLFLLFGQKMIPDIGNYWQGRPHIYLIDFEDQKNTAAENLKYHKDNFNAILARTHLKTYQIQEDLIPHDSRMFSDYNALITKAVSLWAWSLEGKKREVIHDQNHGQLIYEPQATLELLEYYYILHHRVLEDAAEVSVSYDSFQIQENILNLDIGMEKASHFGEIRDLLSEGWAILGLKKLKEQIKDALEIRSQKSAWHEKNKVQRLSTKLAIIFGLFAVPNLASLVLQPLWDLFDLPKPIDKDAFSTMLNFISFTCVGFLIWLLFKTSKRLDD